MTTVVSARRRSPRPATVVCAVVAAVIALIALFPSVLTSSAPIDANLAASLQPPSADHWFGTDQLGRDIYTRIVYGLRYSVGIGLGATIISVILGALVGLLAGVSTKAVDGILMRLIDVLLAFPSILLALLVIIVVEPVLGRGALAVLIAIGLGSFPSYARIVRAEAMVVRRSGFIEAATVMGLSHWQTVVRHILPNALGSLGIMATLGVGISIITGSALSFLGLGPQAPIPEWGVMLSDGRNLLGVAWWTSVFPGLAITVTVIAITLVGQYAQRRFERRKGA